MYNKQNILLWVGLGVTVILGSLWQFYPIEDAKERLSTLPLKGKQFIGYNVPLTEFEKKTFHEINLVKRFYNVNGQKVFLTIMDGTKNRHIVHDPTYCFSGGGWKVLERVEFPLDKGVAHLIRLQKGKEHKEFILYFTDGQTQHASPTQYFLQATFRRLTLGKLSEEPVMVMVQPYNNKKIEWKPLFKSFQDLNKF